MLPNPIQQIILEYLDIDRNSVPFEKNYTVDSFSWLVDVLNITKNYVLDNQ
jgi:hypothetical protein